MNFLRQRTPIIVALAIVAAGLSIGIMLATSFVTIASDEDDFHQRALELKLIEDYVDHEEVDGYHIQTLKVDSALDDPLISAETVDLAVEIVGYQNALRAHGYYYEKEGLTKEERDRKLRENPKPEVNSYPKIETFFRKATEDANRQADGKSKSAGGIEIGPIQIRGMGVSYAWHAHACGHWGHFVPNYTPTRHHYEGSGITFFNDNGYHPTPYYAIIVNPTAAHFTLPRGYDGDNGYCRSPWFRNHGIIHDLDNYSIQFGEPNPEVLHLAIWEYPYFDWPVYNAWWHLNH